jgi:hypothetical protein
MTAVMLLVCFLIALVFSVVFLETMHIIEQALRDRERTKRLRR